jgi:hypothetical protein
MPSDDSTAPAYDGFTLYTCASASPVRTQAFLIDMRGEVVHRWMIPFSQVWPNPPHLRGRISDSLVCFFGCHLDPNGDLMVVFLGADQTGCGLAKLDRNSNVLWKFAAPVHHDVDVREDGSIVALIEEVQVDLPKGLEHIGGPALVDSLVVLSSEGIPLKKPLSLVEALLDSPYRELLSALDTPPTPSARAAAPAGPRSQRGASARELLHANSVKVLRGSLAPSFPDFKAGQVLVSMRDINALAVVDLEERSIVWAACGPWRAQHDPHFLENGRLLLFDNHGLTNESRVLEYDPRSQALPWSYSVRDGMHFRTNEGGMCQRLANGNTLIVSSEDGKILEVTHDKKRAWSTSIGRIVTSARRYSPDQVRFLDRNGDGTSAAEASAEQANEATPQVRRDDPR